MLSVKRGKDLQQMLENSQALRQVFVFFLQKNLDQGRQQVPTHTSHYVL